MSKPSFLTTSLRQLTNITKETYNPNIRDEALAMWHTYFQAKNPLWQHITAKPFSVDGPEGSAHVMAIVDKRLPGKGLVGFFACTTPASGVQVLDQATAWLKKQPGVTDVYGPINGTITRDYRFNVEDDYQIPGEPINPSWYINVFKQAGFKIFNRYVSGIAKHYQVFIKFKTLRRPSADYAHIVLRPFSTDAQMDDLKTYHSLMNDIFPHNSIYCPVLSWEERVYNVAGHQPIFDPKYSFFLEDDGKAIGFIVAYPYNQQLIIKTIGLLPQYRKKNLSGLLLKQVHDQAEADGLGAAVYSTIRVGNAVYKMKRPGVKIHRRYVTLHKAL
jgi:hypothetical protein